MRGAIVRWLEWLGYGAESRQKVVRLPLSLDAWKALSLNPAVNDTFFESGKDKAVKGEG